MFITASTVAASRAVTWRRLGIPALFTRTSTPPSSVMAATATASTAAESARSATHIRDSGAWTRQRSSTSASRSWRRATRPTVAPARASASAMPAPMPDDAPVTSTRFPATSYAMGHPSLEARLQTPIFAQIKRSCSNHRRATAPGLSWSTVTSIVSFASCVGGEVRGELAERRRHLGVVHRGADHRDHVVGVQEVFVVDQGHEVVLDDRPVARVERRDLDLAPPECCDGDGACVVKGGERLEMQAVGALEAGLALGLGRACRRTAQHQLGRHQRQARDRRQVVALGRGGRHREDLGVEGRRRVEHREPRRAQQTFELGHRRRDLRGRRRVGGVQGEQQLTGNVGIEVEAGWRAFLQRDSGPGVGEEGRVEVGHDDLRGRGRRPRGWRPDGDGRPRRVLRGRPRRATARPPPG